MAATTDYTDLLATLDRVQAHDFTILRLSSSIAAANTEHTRSSDASALGSSSTPSALQADLLHYKELFSKLRFSYLEQVTKEKFLRSITDDPPLLVTPAENSTLEHQLSSAKSDLRASKADVDATLSALEALAARLSAAKGRVDAYSAAARTLPAEVSALELQIGVLGEGEGGMMVGLEETRGVLVEREAELRRLEGELEELEREGGRRGKVLGGLEAEVGALTAEREGLERLMGEAVRMRGVERAEGRAEGEMMGRWYKSVFEGLEALLEK